MSKRYMHTTLLSLSTLVLVAAVSGCSPYKYNDDDNLCSKAKPLPPVVVVKDELNSRLGDVADCRTLKYFKDAQAKVTYRVGTAFEEHNLKGLLTVYDEDGQVLDQKGVDPTIPKYEFELAVQGNRPYYVEFKITEGQYAYQAQVQFTKLDPCSKCTADEECVDGACQPKVEVCDPACDDDAGMACEKGRCAYQCARSCKRKKRRGFICEVETGDCVRVRKQCRPRCQSDSYCNYRKGRCYKKKPANPCAGGCKPGTICKDNKCIAIGVKTEVSPIRGRVASILRAGTSSILYLNRGSSHGVKKGARGTLCGKFKISVKDVYPARSKARINKSIEELGDCKSFTIRR